MSTPRLTRPCPRGGLFCGALVFFLLAIAGSAPASAESGPRLGTHLQLTTGYALAGSIDAFNTTSLDVPVFGLGVHHRWRSVDLGVHVGHVLSGRFADVVDPGRPRYGGQVFASLLFRWRFVTPDWGAIFLHVDLGFMAFEHTPAAQRSIGNDGSIAFDPASADRSLADPWTPGFTSGSGLGVLFRVVDAVDMTLLVQSLVGVTEVEKSGFSNSYVLAAVVLTLGVEVGL